MEDFVWFIQIWYSCSNRVVTAKMILHNFIKISNILIKILLKQWDTQISATKFLKVIYVTWRQKNMSNGDHIINIRDNIADILWEIKILFIKLFYYCLCIVYILGVFIFWCNFYCLNMWPAFLNCFCHS